MDKWNKKEVEFLDRYRAKCFISFISYNNFIEEDTTTTAIFID